MTETQCVVETQPECGCVRIVDTMSIDDGYMTMHVIRRVRLVLPSRRATSIDPAVRHTTYTISGINVMAKHS